MSTWTSCADSRIRVELPGVADERRPVEGVLERIRMKQSERKKEPGQEGGVLRNVEGRGREVDDEAEVVKARKRRHHTEVVRRKGNWGVEQKKVRKQGERRRRREAHDSFWTLILVANFMIVSMLMIGSAVWAAPQDRRNSSWRSQRPAARRSASADRGRVRWGMADRRSTSCSQYS